ncbi:MAG TPA: ATP-binding protein [Cytophagaceae bacterium]
MRFKDLPIRQKLVSIIMLTSGAVLILTVAGFFAYEFFTFRHTIMQHLTTLGKIVAYNSTAALAFDDPDEAVEILSALKAEKHIVAAGLYDINGKLFSHYPAHMLATDFPSLPSKEGFFFDESFLQGFQPVVQGNKRLGTLYIKSDLGALEDRLKLYFIIVVLIMAFSSLLAFLLSKIMEKRISDPILDLADTARSVYEHGDYSVRAMKQGKDEIGSFTDAFNKMLMRIEEQSNTLSDFNNQLQLKVAELQKTNADLDNFIYTASHDLKAPISNIEGLVISLNEELSTTKNQQTELILQIIEVSIQKFKNTILDLTEIAKIQKEIDSEIEEVDIQLLLDEIISSIQNIITKVDVEIQINLSCKIIRYSKKNLRSILYNLISNAIKYHSPHRKPEVRINTWTSDGYCIISVKDNGLGLAPYQKEKVFAMFKRFHDHVEGTGIGLYIVKRIVENSGGKIEVETEKEVGSEFKVYLKMQ